MLYKQGISKLVAVAARPETLLLGAQRDIVLPQYYQRRLAAKLAAYAPIKLNPERFLYLRNRAISAEESWGPNQNWDAFPATEIRAGTPTFPGAMLDIDHDPSLPIGSVVDSFYIPKGVLSALSAGRKAAEGQSPVLVAFAGYDHLQAGDQIVGDWVENAWAIDKQALESFYPHAVEAIMDGGITDTSMGCEIDYSQCSICANKAADPSAYCEHVGRFMINKGTLWPHPVTGMKVPAYERCFGVRFFEDAMILPEDWNGSPGSQGADVSAKILQIFAGMGAGRKEGDIKRFAGQLRLLYNRLPEDKKGMFVDILQSIQ